MSRKNGFMVSLSGRFLLIALIALILMSISTRALTPSVDSTHFLVYDLANAGSLYDQALDNYLEQAYSLYTTTLGMKMAPPCNGSQYIVYVVPFLSGSEAGITEWEYTYTSTGQITSTCIEYINISAGLSSQWLEHTAYHELVHVSQWAYIQYITIPQNYPWYIEADAEGTASYYTNQCPLAQDYFQYNQYEYDPYDYSGKPIINMYYYSAFIYWLIANSIRPAEIEQNVFSSNSVVNSWLDNYYVQYLTSIVHGQDLCGSTYYPSFQTISMSGSTYSFSVSLQGLGAQYYEVQLPATGTIEITASGGSVVSNIELNSAFSITNTTLYMAVVNPTTNSETATLTIGYTPGVMARIVNGTYNVMKQSLTLELYVTYGTTPITGTIYVNGTSVSANNGYVSIAFTGITWGTYAINVTYENSTALAYVTLMQPTMSLITSSTLYLTSNSLGYLVFSVNNPNNMTLITNVMITSPPSPTNMYKPMIYFEPSNETLTLSPGASTVRVYFFTNATVSSSQGDIYLYNSPSTAITLGYNVVPVQVGITNATYYLNDNYTVINTYIINVGVLQSMIRGLAGSVYVNYSTYTITVIKVNITSPTIKLLPRITVLAPHWALINATIELMTPKSCPNYPVFYKGVLYVNNTYVGSVLVPCNSESITWGLLNMTYTKYYIVLSITNTTINTGISIVYPLINVINYLWNITGTNEYVFANLSVYGPYKYVVLGHEISNSTLQVMYTLPMNYTVLTINTGFGNITILRPTPIISLESPAIIIYPQTLNVVVNVTMPPTLTYRGLLNTYLNGSLYSSMTVNLPPGKSTLISIIVKPAIPSIFTINVKLGIWSSSNITAASVEINGLSVQVKPLVIIGRAELINITIIDNPPIELPVNLTLQGCLNETTTVMANTSLSLGFNNECALYINASSYTLTSEAISYWDYLNMWLGNIIGYYEGIPLILNETVTAYATFLNNSKVPATVLINGTSTFTPEYLGSTTLILSINYLGVTNESLLNVFVVPPTYFEAEEILNELGNPPFLNSTIGNAITSGNWGLINKIVNEYQESSRQYDPLAQLSRYLLVQAIMNGDISKISLVSTILKYEFIIYAAFLLIIILIIVMVYRVSRARSRKT
ncbi:hypothetical protein [Vulcanisaeta moutnovskia]|nr:hypothetical protein [Vulcanisaeta moutnovskia]